MRAFLVGFLGGCAAQRGIGASVMPERVHPPFYGEGNGLESWVWHALELAQAQVESGQVAVFVIGGLLAMSLWPGCEWALRKGASWVWGMRRSQRFGVEVDGPKGAIESGSATLAPHSKDFFLEADIANGPDHHRTHAPSGRTRTGDPGGSPAAEGR